MSRFDTSDCYDVDDEDVENYQKTVSAAWRRKRMKADMREFLAYLNAMLRKRIAKDVFMNIQTGETCAVATYCAFKGISSGHLEEIETRSADQREIYGFEDCGGYDGPTVNAGVNAGLPREVSQDLAWRNDEEWDFVEDGYEDQVSASGWTFKAQKYRAMTPEERWLKLRNYVATKCGQPEIEAQCISS